MGKLSNISNTLYDYFNEFGVNGFLEKAPPNTPFPYLTYTLSYSENYADNLIQVRIWDKSSSVVKVVELADDIGDNIGDGRTIKGLEGGTLWLKKGEPFAQFVPEEDITIKSIYLNIVTNLLV